MIERKKIDVRQLRMQNRLPPSYMFCSLIWLLQRPGSVDTSTDYLDFLQIFKMCDNCGRPIDQLLNH